MTQVAAPTWADFVPRYESLAVQNLTPQNVADWIERWSDLQKDVQQANTVLMRAKDADPSDRAAEGAYLMFVQEVLPENSRADQKLTEKLLALQGWTPEPQHVQMLRRLKEEAALFREANVPLETEIQTLTNEFNKITGALRATVRGEELSIPQAQKLLLGPDRDLREDAWRAIQAANLSAAPQLDDLFLKLLKLRRRVAKNAGFDNFRDMVWQGMNRFDYTPENTQELHRGVEKFVKPLLKKMYGARREQLGLDTLRPWDVSADPAGGEALKPFESTRELEDLSQSIFTALDPELGAQFGAMREGGYLDLDPRPEKVPGYGYCTYLPVTGTPAIYWSAVGTDTDVRVVMHEGGHAFHFLASGKPEDLIWNQLSPIEFAEVGSQAMELLTLPLLEKPTGFYNAQDAARARRDKLETVLRQFTSQSTGDAFQQWLYSEAPENVTIADIDAKWTRCSERFEAGVDWSGLEWERAKGWQFVHIFVIPLYLIEYSLAWMGALQIWRRALGNPAQALARYKAALALGNTRPLPELFETAGARFAFDEGTVGELMEFLGRQLNGPVTA